ncbi:MAG: hypothetical protein IPI95_04900 [Flavobacteriales bacterium]|nr:hypothetical protein [Flavobacteriales bacterium]
MVLRRFLLFLAWLPAVALIAQTSGELRLEIDPPTSFSYRLDHQFTMQQAGLELLEGAHHFSFWAPQRKLMDTTITIAGGEARSLALRLPFSKEYLVYQRDLKAFRNDRQVMRLIPAVATGASLLYTSIRYSKMKKAHDRLDDDRQGLQ